MAFQPMFDAALPIAFVAPVGASAQSHEHAASMPGQCEGGVAYWAVSDGPADELNKFAELFGTAAPD
ncbi:MAG TPA: hypothetical protein VKT99_22280 [Xanthobacteraceae bacterium]|nr:hypothetical protein [Xanthobacteraceae bacterium]